VVDEIDAGQGEQRMRRPGRAVSADDVDEQRGEQGTGGPVVRRVEERDAVRTLLDLLEDERNLPVIQFELDDGVEDGEDALARRRGRTERRWARIDGVGERRDSGFKDGAKQAGPIAETAEQGTLAHPAAAATSSIVTVIGSSTAANSVLAAVRIACRFRAASARSLTATVAPHVSNPKLGGGELAEGTRRHAGHALHGVGRAIFDAGGNGIIQCRQELGEADGRPAVS